MIIRKDDLEIFNGKIKKIGDSYGILIPSNIIKFQGWKIGDEIRFYAKKVTNKIKQTGDE